MDKPRICEVLGVEVGERVYYKDPNDEMLQFFVQPDGVPVFVFESGKPVGKIGMGYAIAQAINHPDCIIRILDWAGKEGLDMDAIIREKMEYNRTRPYRHGGKVL